MTTATEKQSQGYVMTSEVFESRISNGEWIAVVSQDGRRVFLARGCESQQHAEQIATDIRVRYGLKRRPTI